MPDGEGGADTLHFFSSEILIPYLTAMGTWDGTTNLDLIADGKSEIHIDSVNFNGNIYGKIQIKAYDEDNTLLGTLMDYNQTYPTTQTDINLTVPDGTYKLTFMFSSYSEPSQNKAAYYVTNLRIS